ncbi:MAG: HEAT repeat domain-containing protein, partial [Verrucomicrobiia bacterium]
EISGAIYRIRRQASKPTTDPRGNKIQWANLRPAALAKHLNDSRFKVRDRAIAELARHNDAAIPSLRKQLRSDDIRSRRNAVWALTRIRTPDARAAVHAALNDKSPSVRLTATRSITTHRDRTALAWLKKHVISDEAAIRRECATALGRIADRSAVPALLTALETIAGDRSLHHAVV